MIDPNLLGAIKENQAQGRSDDIIQEILLQQGWAQASIDEAYASLSGQPAQTTPVATVQATVKNPALQVQPSAPISNPPPAAIDEAIENVGVSTSDYLKKHPGYFTIPLIVSIILVVIFFLLKVTTSEFYFLPILLPIIGYNIARGKIQHEFMQQFAAANNYTYALRGNMDGLDGTLFQIGHNRAVADVVSGQYEGNPISLFSYTYVTGSGKSQQAHRNTIFELQFNTKMPDILLESGSHSFGESLFQNLKGKTLVKLEGDFNKYFTLYIPKGFEVEALEIFTPDVMQELIEKAKGLSLEIVNGHCFIYANGLIGVKAKLDALYALAEYFSKKLAPLLANMKGSVEAMEAVSAGVA